MTIIVRFAPSPTGYLHIGNARTALINWLYAKQGGGQFVLRLDDTDAQRSTDEFATAIIADLAWLGIKPDRLEHQSARASAHDAAAARLRAKGLLYPCYETPDELERRRKRQMAQGKPPIYDRAALRIDDEERKELESQGRTPHWRFMLPNHDGDPFHTRRTEVNWHDLVRGPQTVDLASMSDPVLVRGDGGYLYTLPSVVDDVEFGVTAIIRGDDHVTNTGVQIALFKALDATPPEFGHHNLLTTASGEGLSKRLGSLSLQGLRKDGFEAMAVASLAVLIGTSGPVEALADMNALAARLSLGAISKSPARFDVSELENLNARLVHHMDYDQARPALKEVGADAGAEFWHAVRGNLQKVQDAEIWRRAVEAAKPEIDADDREFISRAAAMLPLEPWDETIWKTWTDALKAETGRKGRQLFMPIRKALTGHDHGPELAQLLPLIGRQRTLDRLS